MIITPGFALDYETNPVCTSDNQTPAMDEVRRMSIISLKQGYLVDGTAFVFR